jgi:O-antigen ligase
MSDFPVSSTGRGDDSRYGALLVFSGFLLVLYFALSPVVPGVITGVAGFIAIFSAVVGWRGLRLLPPQSRLLFLAFVFYVVVALLSLFNNENWQAAGWRFEKYHPFLFAIPIMGWLALQRERLQHWLLAAMMASALAIVGITLYQQFWLYAERVGYGTGINPNIFGHVGSLVALTLLGFALFGRFAMLLRLGLLLLAMGALYGVFSTGSRGAVLAFFAGMLALVFANLLRGGVTRRQLLIILAVCLSGLLFFAMVVHFSGFWQAHWQRLLEEPGRFLNGDTTYTSVSARAVLWISGWKTGLEHPFLGTGIGDTQLDFDRLMAAGALPQVPDTSEAILHNIFFDSFASTGLIGLSSMLLAIFVMPMRYFLQSLGASRAQGTQVAAAMAGMALLTDNFVFGLTNSWLYLRGLPFVLILLLALLVLAGSRFGDSSSQELVRE